MRSITRIDKEEFRKNLVSLSTVYTTQADMEFDEHGKIIRKEHPGNDLGLSDTIVVDREEGSPDQETLFDVVDRSATTRKRKTPRPTASQKKRKKKRRTAR